MKDGLENVSSFFHKATIFVICIGAAVIYVAFCYRIVHLVGNIGGPIEEIDEAEVLGDSSEEE